MGVGVEGKCHKVKQGQEGFINGTEAFLYILNGLK